MLSSLVLQLVVAFMMAHHNSALVTGATGCLPPALNFRPESHAKVSRATRQQKPIETTCNLLETIRVGTRHSTMKPTLRAPHFSRTIFAAPTAAPARNRRVENANRTNRRSRVDTRERRAYHSKS